MNWKEPFERFAKYAANLALLDAENIDVEDLRRVNFTCNGEEYTIRMWNIRGDVITDYTLYKMLPGQGGKTIYNCGNYELR